MNRYLGLTLRQTEALTEIAFGSALPRASRRVLETLEKRGLIVHTPDKILGVDVLGPVAIPQYEMPTHEHIAFCEWCSSLSQEDG